MRSARAALLVFAGIVTSTQAAPPFGFGRTPGAEEVHALDIAIGPDGRELPAGSGGVAAGAALYAVHCAACHGASGHEGPDNRLVGGQGTLAGPDPQLTIGSYWPHATTVFDYVRRAMPFPAPGSLEDDEVYSLTAFLLHENGIVAGDFVADRESLPAVRMPNRDGFVPDPRPEQFNRAGSAPQGE